MNYSTFMNGLKKAGITLNRKMLAEIAVADAAAFTALLSRQKLLFNEDQCARVLATPGVFSFLGIKGVQCGTGMDERNRLCSY